MKKILLAILIIALMLVCFACKEKDIDDADIKYIMDISIGDTVIVNQTIELKNVYQENLTQLKFHLYPNSYREGAENKAYSSELINYGGIEIMQLRANDKEAYFTLSPDKNIMTVRLPKQKLDSLVKLEMQYELTMPECNLRLGKYNGAYNFGNFYPVLAYYQDGKWREDKFTDIGDPFLSAMADYEVTVKCPKELVIACTGKIESSLVEDNVTITNIKANNVRDFAMVANNNFKVMTKMVKNTTVLYYYYNDNNPEDTLNVAANALNLFGKAFGKYPYSTYSVVETPFAHGGMEYPTLVYISGTISDEAREDVVIHETAHQWWSVVVGNDSINQGFIDEGLATFSTAYYYMLNKEEDKFQKLLAESKSSYFGYMKLKQQDDLDYISNMNRSLYEYSADEYYALCYDKSSVMFKNVYDLIGKRKFEKSLKMFFENNQFKVVGKDELYSSFNKASGTDIGKIFESWIDGTVQVFGVI